MYFCQGRVVHLRSFTSALFLYFFHVWPSLLGMKIYRNCSPCYIFTPNNNNYCITMYCTHTNTNATRHKLTSFLFCVPCLYFARKSTRHGCATLYSFTFHRRYGLWLAKLLKAYLSSAVTMFWSQSKLLVA